MRFPSWKGDDFFLINTAHIVSIKWNGTHSVVTTVTGNSFDVNADLEDVRRAIHLNEDLWRKAPVESTS